MKQEIPLTDEECAAVEDGIEALGRLSVQLLDVATPAGPTPRQLVRGASFVALAELAPDVPEGPT